MKHRDILVWIGLYLLLMLFQPAQLGYAQGQGFVTPLPANAASLQNALPPGAVYERGKVRHVIDPRENLHILAAYYYGDPRQWQRIYRENRSVIRNPNRLPAGQTLQISVGESWRPLFMYQEWLQLAHRNGLWQPGQWQRAAKSSGQPMAVPISAGPESAQTTAPTTQTPPERKTPIPVTPKIEPTVPAEPIAPTVIPPVAEEPQPVEQTPVAEQTPQEKPAAEPEEEQAPAF
ncbi:hypothetical protein U27_03825 [Candidatus Vecturithrix granuli]|uniref:LysM domain-containing protein n=1 Tax=Vecturithrix granuli TaxID=1499967 RepID=A0A081BX06_VECG1|nr:hypothetical protein U27_03825 [Candidatus Vecturithrix granuli]